VDFDAQRPGRGAYLHPAFECVERFVGLKVKEFRALKRRIEPSARVEIAAAIKCRLDRN